MQAALGKKITWQVHGKFDTIRKTQKFLVEQAKINNVRVIDNVDISDTIDIMVNDILEKFGGIEDDR